MDQHRTLIKALGENEIREIEPIIERVNGLRELLLIATDNRMLDKITNEILSLESKRDAWWKKIKSQNNWERYLSDDWKIDFGSNRIWIIL